MVTTLALLMLAWQVPTTPAADPPNLYPATVREIHDADTFHADIALPWGEGILNRPVRLLGFDAWEVTRARRTVGPITDAELARGAAARAALRGLLADSEAAYLQPGPKALDPYGRLLGRLWLRPKGGGGLIDVAEWMKQHGHDRTGR